MLKKNLTLFIEINNSEFIFVVSNNSDNDSFEILHKDIIPIQGISNNKISDYELISSVLKKNILSIEQKINIIFQDVILIIDNFDCALLNFSGYKKLNGSQLVKENITYILNSLKSKINEIEKNYSIIHIFNSKYKLDGKETENLPIGLFGNFYSHELSFFLIENNDLKNVKKIFNQCNLQIKKIISKSFIECAALTNQMPKNGTFFKIKIDKKNSKIFFFENSSLKYIQEFKFGSEIVLDDVSKITGLNVEIVKNILKDTNPNNEITENETVEKKFFEGSNFRKIKKKLIFDIAKARIQEMSEIILVNNINIKSFINKKSLINLKVIDDVSSKYFKENYKLYFSNKGDFEINFLENNTFEDIYEHANRIVQYGWKKEAIPIIHQKKSIISRFFNLFFK